MRLARRLGTVILVAAVITVVVAFAMRMQTASLGGSAQVLAAKPDSYLGVYVPGVPASDAGLAAFGSKTGTRPNVAAYYSGWLEPFQSTFATELSTRGAVPLVQMDPTDIGLAAIAHGRYDKYLASYAQAVRGFDRPVIISFGHEMNGDWYSWANGRTSPRDFVAAWRHIVRVFRSRGAYNVTWLWTINSLAGGPGQVAGPQAWWPGASYVTWVGIDGYYYYPAESFTTLFGTTISAIRRFTGDPVLITETGISPTAGKAAKIPGLFAGARSAGILGLVYFDAKRNQDWRLDQDADALAALRKAAHGFG